MPSAGHEIERRVERFIKAERLLAPGDSLLLAVSGGADSLALLAVMARLAPRLDIRLRVVYVDHQLRPNEQIAADIETVTDAATAFHLPLSISRVPPRHRQDGRSPEQYAREVRYRALAEEAARHH